MSLAIDALHVSLAGTRILHDVDLFVPAGSCTAVLGPSGAGKTTLLRAITGLETPTSGSITLDDQPLLDVPTERRQVAMVFQDARLFPSMDVGANVGFPLRMAGAAGDRTAGDRMAGEVAEALAAVGLPDFGRRDVRGLSGGEEQRVALARALVGRPKLLLLDEPFAAVDPDLREELRELVDRLRRERGVTTVLVTHDRDDAALVGDRIAVLLAGTIVQHDPVRKVLTQPSDLEVAGFVGCDVVLATADGTLVARPEQVRLGAGPFDAEVGEVALASDHARVHLKVDATPPHRPGITEVVIRVPVAMAPTAGERVTFDLPHGWLLRDRPTQEPHVSP